MRTIKKKDLNKYKPKQELDELVDGEGSPIEGDLVKTNDGGLVNNTQITTAPQQTSDEFATLAIQPRRYFYNTAYSHGDRGTPRESVNPSEKKELDEVAKEKMKKMVEDIVTRKLNNEVVPKTINPDVNSNEIPDIDELANNLQKPTPVRHTQIFIDDIKKTPLTGDEIAIILNYILSNFNEIYDMSTISSNYKNILRKKI